MVPAQKPKILLVDDVEANTALLARILQKECDLVQVHSGAAALEALGTDDFDLVLLDVMMPSMSGLEVLTQVRRDYSLQDLPVLLVSALDDTRDIVTGLEAGANDYLIKPINKDMVRTRVHTHLNLKALADERRTTMAMLEEANEVKQRLMRIASHDLKNPLQNLTMVLTLVRDDLPPENAAYMDMAERYLRDMQSIIEEFLDLEIIKDDRIQIQLRPVALAATLRGVLGDYETAAEKKKIQIREDVPPLAVIADEKRLWQVLANLVSNAIKYSPMGGRVQIVAEVSENALFLHIRDEGVGIPPGERDKLFQPFGKLSTKPTAGEHSSGLGLWIVKQMMMLQGGDVGLNADYEDGADFWVRLPLAD